MLGHRWYVVVQKVKDTPEYIRVLPSSVAVHKSGVILPVLLCVTCRTALRNLRWRCKKFSDSETNHLWITFSENCPNALSQHRLLPVLKEAASISVRCLGLLRAGTSDLSGFAGLMQFYVTSKEGSVSDSM